MLFTAAELDHATEVVRRHMPPTPQYVWPLLGAEIGAAELDGGAPLGGAPVEVWVKHENHTPTGAFKVRGGYVYMDRLRRERPNVAGVISATRGNHGQSLAVAGRAAGVGVTIVVPHGNSPDKNAAMAGFGAELIEHGVDYQAALEHSRVVAAERGVEPVGPFHIELVHGVATYAKELFDAAGQRGPRRRGGACPAAYDPQPRRARRRDRARRAAAPRRAAPSTRQAHRRDPQRRQLRHRPARHDPRRPHTAGVTLPAGTRQSWPSPW